MIIKCKIAVTDLQSAASTHSLIVDQGAKHVVVGAEGSYSLYIICNMMLHRGSEIRQHVFDDLCHWHLRYVRYFSSGFFRFNLLHLHSCCCLPSLKRHPLDVQSKL